MHGWGSSSTAACVLATLWACACSRPASTSLAPPAPDIIETMRDLTTAPALTLGVVQKAFDTDLSIAPGSHDMVTFYEGRPKAGSRFERTVKLIDLRVPTARNDVMGDPFLVVETKEEAGITARDVERLLGRPPEIDVPEPNPETALDYIYTLGPHRLWVGLGHGEAEPIRSFSIHRNEARR
jgi:hypothetical protein